ncbi:MAG: helix-turn-helix transcriptional regulator [Legionellales bacterium]|nr:helix-turn-helix transcriptional regulator [Legionellales bacterium]
MTNELIISNQHFFFSVTEQLNALVKPLKDYFGITSFVYLKNFHNGEELRLSNQPEWIDYYYHHQLYKHNVFERAPGKYKKQHILWAALPENTQTLHFAKKFGIDYGITFINPVADGCEFFFLGTTPDRPDVMARYISHLDLLEQFLLSWKENANGLLQDADKHRLILPKELDKEIAFLQPEKIDTQAFLSTVSNKTQFKMTDREGACAALLLRGYTMKMIGQSLDISPRTVETHLDNLKRKTGSFSKGSLIKYLEANLFSLVKRRSE